jgi:hypothetical protein
MSIAACSNDEVDVAILRLTNLEKYSILYQETLQLPDDVRAFKHTRSRMKFVKREIHVDCKVQLTGKQTMMLQRLCGFRYPKNTTTAISNDDSNSSGDESVGNDSGSDYEETLSKTAKRMLTAEETRRSDNQEDAGTEETRLGKHECLVDSSKTVWTRNEIFGEILSPSNLANFNEMLREKSSGLKPQTTFKSWHILIGVIHKLCGGRSLSGVDTRIKKLAESSLDALRDIARSWSHDSKLGVNAVEAKRMLARVKNQLPPPKTALSGLFLLHGVETFKFDALFACDPDERATEPLEWALGFVTLTLILARPVTRADVLATFLVTQLDDLSSGTALWTSFIDHKTAGSFGALLVKYPGWATRILCVYKDYLRPLMLRSGFWNKTNKDKLFPQNHSHYLLIYLKLHKIEMTASQARSLVADYIGTLRTDDEWKDHRSDLSKCCAHEDGGVVEKHYETQNKPLREELLHELLVVKFLLPVKTRLQTVLRNHVLQTDPRLTQLAVTSHVSSSSTVRTESIFASSSGLVSSLAMITTPTVPDDQVFAPTVSATPVMDIDESYVDDMSLDEIGQSSSSLSHAYTSPSTTLKRKNFLASPNTHNTQKCYNKKHNKKCFSSPMDFSFVHGFAACDRCVAMYGENGNFSPARQKKIRVRPFKLELSNIPATPVQSTVTPPPPAIVPLHALDAKAISIQTLCLDMQQATTAFLSAQLSGDIHARSDHLRVLKNLMTQLECAWRHESGIILEE